MTSLTTVQLIEANQFSRFFFFNSVIVFTFFTALFFLLGEVLFRVTLRVIH